MSSGATPHSGKEPAGLTEQLQYAEAFAAAGCCVIPARGDGSKAPAVKWEPYQHQHPTLEQLRRWFAPGGFAGLGVVTGAVSGGLEMLELEARGLHLWGLLGQTLADHGVGDLWARLCSGYLEQSAGGGYHWLYRVEGGDQRRNTKLARRPATTKELTAWKTGEADKARRAVADAHALEARLRKIEDTTTTQLPQVLIETRGEGGYVVTAPSNGTTHPTGRSWILVAGGPATIPTISAAERDLLHAVCTMFDTMPAPTAPPTSSPSSAPTSSHGGETRPGDDYNTQATWEEILEPHGWTKGRRLGRGWAWTRPGKHPRDGFSATTGQADDADRLYVFSSSTTFDTETPYSKFAAYAHLGHGDDLAAAASALRKAGYGAPLEEPRVLGFTGGPQAVVAAPGGPQGPVHAQAAPADPGPSSYSLTDDGNALRLVDQHADVIRYVPQRGMWLRWTGHVWSWDEAETVRELARGIARDLPTDNDIRRKWRTKSLAAAAIGNMVRLARTDPRAVAHLPGLDAQPYELNTPGGIVDLRTGHLRPPDPTGLHTRCTTVAPDFTTPAPRWEKFLADTFAGDPELTTYVQRLIGVSLIGVVLEQILPFAQGSGANGKTTLMGTVQRLVGFGQSGYAMSAPTEILLATRNQDHPATIAQLSGARLVVTSEVEDGAHFAEARVKQLTGRDAINARFMARNPFTFTPSHTLWVIGNHRPQVRTGGPAFWRRYREIPFVHTVPPEQQDRHLEDHLVDEEGPAILAWCIRGAADYLATAHTGTGLTIPEPVRAASEAYQLDQDTVGRFVDDLCTLGEKHDPNLRTKVGTIRSVYESWCHTEGEQPVTAKAFTTALRTQHDVWSERSSSTRYYLGIKLLDIDYTPTWPEQGELGWGGR